MAGEKLRQDVVCIVTAVLLIVRTCSTHDCKDGREQKEGIVASDNIFKVNQQYGKFEICPRMDGNFLLCLDFKEVLSCQQIYLPFGN